MKVQEANSNNCNAGREIHVLYIIPLPIYDSVADAGSKTLMLYLSALSQSDKFKVSVLYISRNNSIGYKRMRSQYSNSCDFYFVNVSVLGSLLRYFYYSTNLKYWLTFLSPKYAQLDIISQYYFRKGIKRLKIMEYSPDIISLEWPELLSLRSYISMIYPKSKIIINEADVAFQRYFRIAEVEKVSKYSLRYKIAKALKKYEINEIDLLDLAVVPSYKDRNLLEMENVPSEKILTIVPSYSIYNNICCQNTKNIIFWGAMTREENIEAVNWFIKNVFKYLYLVDKEFSFTIIGNCSIKNVNRFNGISGVFATGFVSSPTDYFKNALCMAVPLIHGAGIKVKILEGLACGVPILTGSVGIEGIPAINGEHYLHCETKNDYIEAIHLLLGNVEYKNSMIKKAREFMNINFNMEKSVNHYKNVLGTL